MEICSWEDLQNFCDNAGKELNEMFNTCQSLMNLSPFTIPANGATSINSIMDTVIGVISGTAMTLCVLFFLMEFAKNLWICNG